MILTAAQIAEDELVKIRLDSVMQKIERSHSKNAMKHPDAKISVLVTAGELYALRQFARKYHND
jgi:hypothetical protein